LITLAVAVSLLITLILVLTLESQDAALYRAGDLYSICPDIPVIVVPELNPGLIRERSHTR